MENKSMSLGLIITSLILSIPLAFWRGLVLLKLYGWFLIPLGLPTISVANMIGISIIFSMVAYKLPPESDEDPLRSVIRTIVASILIPLLFLISGFVFSLFM